MNERRLTGVWAGLGFCFCSLALGQGDAVAPVARKLTLAEYRQQVAAANQTVASKRLELEISRIEARGERGILEPNFAGNAAFDRTERQNAIEQELNQNSPLFRENSIDASTGVEGLLPLGTKYWVGTSVDKRSNNLTNRWQMVPYTDEYLGFAGVRLTQPLLKNGRLSAVMARIRLADAQIDVRFQELRRHLMMVMSRAELAYWNLALTQHTLRLRNDSVRIADEVLTGNRERVAAGKMSEIEVYEAEAGVAQRRLQQTQAAQTVTAANNLMRTFLSAAAGGEGDSPFEAADAPALKALTTTYDAAMASALEHHPDYLAQQVVIRQEQVRVSYARNQRWPQLDLVGSYGLNGLGETFRDSAEKVGDADFEAWTVGIELRLPLGGGIKERADLHAARLRQQQALLDLKTAEIEIANTVDTAVKQVRASQAQADASRVVVDFKQRLLDSELGRLAAGKSDSRRVLEIEQDLVEAKLNHFLSLVEHCKAHLDWEVAQGTLLDARGIEPAPPTGRRP